MVQAHRVLWIYNAYGIQCILMLLLYTTFLLLAYTQDISFSVSPPFLPSLLHTSSPSLLRVTISRVRLMPSLPIGEIIDDAWHETMGTHKVYLLPQAVKHPDLLFTSNCYILGCIKRSICQVLQGWMQSDMESHNLTSPIKQLCFLQMYFQVPQLVAWVWIPSFLHLPVLCICFRLGLLGKCVSHTSFLLYASFW